MRETRRRSPRGARAQPGSARVRLGKWSATEEPPRSGGCYENPSRELRCYKTASSARYSLASRIFSRRFTCGDTIYSMGNTCPKRSKSYTTRLFVAGDFTRPHFIARHRAACPASRQSQALNPGGCRPVPAGPPAPQQARRRDAGQERRDRARSASATSRCRR